MGISDRTYQQSPPHQSFDAGPRRPSRLDGSPVVKWLLIINVAVWLLDMLTNSAPQMQRSFLWSWGHFSVAAAVEQFQLWRFLSFQFLHANGHHLLVNMLGLFFFGHFAERWWGSRKFLFFYLATGVAGALFYVVLVLRRGFRFCSNTDWGRSNSTCKLYTDGGRFRRHFWHLGLHCRDCTEFASAVVFYRADEHAQFCCAGTGHQCDCHFV